MTILHALIKVPAADHAAVIKFYTEALKPLDSSLLMSLPSGLSGFGGEKPEYFITKSDETPSTKVHLAFRALGMYGTYTYTQPQTPWRVYQRISWAITKLTLKADRAAVDAFHAAGVAAGGKDNGAPGYRANIHPDYYAAFVLDPAGNNIEAACMTPQAGNAWTGAVHRTRRLEIG
jgi:hypothetical protein